MTPQTPAGPNKTPSTNQATYAKDNRYAYVGADPINLADSSGTSFIGDALGVTGTVMGTAVVCGTTSTGVGAVACGGALPATAGVIANAAEHHAKRRRRRR